jgi:hypothetical protein
VASDLIGWVASYQEARDRAAREGKPLFVDVWAPG